MGVPIPPPYHRYLTAARRFLRHNRFWLGLAAFVGLGLTLAGLLGPSLRRADEALTLGAAIEMHRRGQATCTGLPPMMDIRVDGGTLLLLLASPPDSAVMLVLRERDAWPRFIMPRVPLLVCRDRRDDVIWIGHAGFEGQGQMPRASIP